MAKDTQNVFFSWGSVVLIIFGCVALWHDSKTTGAADCLWWGFIGVVSLLGGLTMLFLSGPRRNRRRY